MKIGIDARLIGETGVGRYIRNLISELARLDTQNEYVVFLRKRSFAAFELPGANWQKKEADIPWHGAREQLVMPWIFLREHLDLVHIPYFNAPIFYPKKYIITIHDLIILHFDTGKASMLPYWLYKVRRLGYRIILGIGIRRAAHVIAVSETVKKDVTKTFGVKSPQITVTYEGVDSHLKGQLKNNKTSPISGKFFLYVGNVYPHKNIEMLLEAYMLYRGMVKHPARLVFVGPSDYFYKRLETLLPSLGLPDEIQVLHGVDDHQLSILLHQAIALMFPSKMEGFGLPALEALSLGCPVICSDIPVFREILKGHAFFADADSPSDFAQKMKSVSQKTHNRVLYRTKLVPFLSLYTWRQMAEKTQRLYIQSV
jgi:glycosyltransferase involved in cell wall biosynthesis